MDRRKPADVLLLLVAFVVNPPLILSLPHTEYKPIYNNAYTISYGFKPSLGQLIVLYSMSLEYILRDL